MTKSLIALFLFAVPGLASAQSVENILPHVHSGSYTQGLGVGYDEKDKMYFMIDGERLPVTHHQVSVNGNVLSLKDTQNNIEYKINTNGGVLPAEYLNLLKNNYRTSVIGQMIQRITVGAIRKGQQPGELVSTIFIDFKYQPEATSDYPIATLTLALDASVIVHEAKAEEYVRSGPKTYKATVLEVHAGQNLRLVKFHSSFSDLMNNVVGTVVDLGLRFASLGSQVDDRLIQIQK